jgi:hypothetical protein
VAPSDRLPKGWAALAAGVFATHGVLLGACVRAPIEHPPPAAASAEPAPEPAHPDAGLLAPVFLGEATVVNHLGALPPADQPIRVTLELVHPAGKAFEELAKRATALPGGPSAAVFSAVGYPASRDPVSKQDSHPSFVIDYDEPSVQALRKEVTRLCGPSPTPDQLARFVDGYIDHKDLLRAFDLASQVARRKEGDCTEHAVLLTALLRTFGFPARVVTGMAIVATGGTVEAVGHAWVEVHQAGRWKLADAAIPLEMGARYLPLEVMDDEGPAFSRRMVERPSPLLLIRRVVLDAAPN